MTALDKQMDEMLLEIKYLKSDKHVNGIKADGVEAFVNFVIETGELSGSDNKFMRDFAQELRNK